MKNNLRISKLILLFILVFLQSCFFNGQPKENPSLKREIQKGVETIETDISAESYEQALSGYSVNKIRLVPITHSATGGEGVPEYRLFSIDEGSTYDLVGLKNADILLSLDGYILTDMDKFPIYMTLVKNQGYGQIEIKRDKRIYLLKFKIS